MKKITHGSFISLLGLTVLLLTQLKDSDPYLKVALFGSLPLTVYFVILLLCRKSLTKLNIDSIYYFGFLVTIISLALSAAKFDLGNNVDGSLNVIIDQFSVGLIATGLALVYRLILQTMAEGKEDLVDNINTQTIAIQKFREEVGKMFYEFENASKSLTNFANTSLDVVNTSYKISEEQLQKLHSESLNILSKSIGDAVGQTFEGIKESSTMANKSIVDFSRNLTSISESANFTKFPALMNNVSSSFQALQMTLQASIPSIQHSTNEINTHQKSLANTIALSNEAANITLDFATNLSKISDNSGLKNFPLLMSNVTSSFQVLQTSLLSSLPAMQQATTEITKQQSSLSSTIALSGEASQALVTFKKKIEEDGLSAMKTKNNFDLSVSVQTASTIASMDALTLALKDLNERLSKIKEREPV